MYDQSQATKAQKGAIAPLQQANQAAYSAAEGIANTPYTPYTGQQVAPITGSQEQAVIAGQTNATNDIAGKDIGASSDLAGEIAANGWNSATAAKYMNPYTQNVTNVAQQQLNKQYAQTIANQNASAASQGAFGGDRATLNNAATTGEYLTSSANTAAINQANAYNSAVQTWQADNQRAASAATAYQNAGNDITQMNASQIKDLLATGGVEQATQQMQLNANYNDYLDQRGWAANELQPLLQATGNKGTPAGVTPPNTASDLLGMGSALAGYFGSSNSAGGNSNPSNLGGSTPVAPDGSMLQYDANGNIIGSVASNADTIESDRRLKRDIEPLTRAANGLMAYRFRYLSGERTFVGYMADEVERLYPQAVSRRADGMLLVAYGRIPDGVFREEKTH